MKYTITLKRHFIKGLVAFELPDEMYRENLARVLRACKEKNNDYVTVTVATPRKPRTLKENNKYWAMVQELAVFTGGDMDDVSRGIKCRAIARGYPYAIDPISQRPEPVSSADTDTAEMALLIETAYEVGADLHYIFREV